MYRSFINVLREWENGNVREPLLVIGARQVGKTWLIRRFCEETYGDYLYINLEHDEDMVSVFENSLDPGNILHTISAYLGRKIDENTAIFIDEIQCCERAVTSLKYFRESEKNYRIIGAGSLLGVKIGRFSGSFPVGKVHIKQMFPMTFFEFLMAADEEILLNEIRAHYSDFSPMPDILHKKALSLYHDYLMVGGMPQAVNSYILNDLDLTGFDKDIHHNLKLAYLADMTKYTTSAAEGVKITEVYNSISRQLGKENPKFKYSEVRKGANSRDFSTALDWLVSSGLVLRVDKLDTPYSPIKGYISKTGYRIYLSDIGLLSTTYGIKYRDLQADAANTYKGAVVENYVVQQFAACSQGLCYFKPADNMEIDLVFDDGVNIVPVEIKSGRHKRSTSLNNYISKYEPKRAVRISELNFGRADILQSIPVYAVECLF